MARSTRAAAAAAAWAERRVFASSKVASLLLAFAFTARDSRLVSHSMRVAGAPMRLSRMPMASPSRSVTRSMPRVSRVLAVNPMRRASPTSASAASWPGHATSKVAVRPGSASRPRARKAPRHAASTPDMSPEMTCRGMPTTGWPDAVTSFRRRITSAAPSSTRTS